MRPEDLLARLEAGYEYDPMYGQLCNERDQLKAENAKLRELVRAFDWCTENFDVPNNCDQCPLAQSDRLVPECEVRMRELGVEATE